MRCAVHPQSVFAPPFARNSRLRRLAIPRILLIDRQLQLGQIFILHIRLEPVDVAEFHRIAHDDHVVLLGVAQHLRHKHL